MDLHHKLRRDPSWHPSGCNICGQLGHQAAQCTTGTVNWRSMYGEHAFVMRPAVFQSDLEAIERAKQIDLDDLEKRAKDYAKMREEEGGSPPQQAPPQGSGQQQQRPQQGQPAQQPAAAAAGAAPTANGAAAAPPPAAEPRKPGEEGLPEGWAVAFDANKKPYYWHRTTKKTTWEKPTADTPIN